MNAAIDGDNIRYTINILEGPIAAQTGPVAIVIDQTVSYTGDIPVGVRKAK